MTTKSKLLVIEGIVPTGNEPSRHKMEDVTMLVQLGGRQRTEAEYRSLLGTGGFRLNRILPVSERIAILEASPE